ncbi:ABC transporter ATP-binding protein [Streptococcus plurextorum]|uniref:ABC transporter ATP-binding protein n=1 Tax=Streptococcus plurextorum TaxID=456876 RepID=UPI0003FDFD9E|nr:ABC transporter ATP-binding protein [Streptococcus plurextorum]
MLKLQHITKQFKDKLLLHHADFQARPGQITLIMGKSGIGKTTLLDIISGLKPFDEGRYFFGDLELNQKSDLKMSAFRSRHIGYILQDFALIEDGTVKENLWLPSLYQKDIPKEDIANRISHLVRFFQLEEVMDKKVKQISGGQKQRAAIIRSLVLDPQIILADEPTANLDEDNVQQVMAILQEQKAKGKVIIIATHDNRTKAYADTIYLLENHKLIRQNLLAEPF